MKQIEKSSMVLGSAVAMSLTGLFALLPFVAAHAGGPTTKVSEPMTVLAMIKAETDVLAQWRAERNKAASRAHPKPALLSIYGVLPQLRATVLIDGREVVFEQGRTLPLSPITRTFRLRHIKPPCVSFTRGSRPQTVCLSRVGS